MRSSNHCNGLNIDTPSREYPEILKSTADRESYLLVRIRQRTLQARKIAILYYAILSFPDNPWC